MKKVLTLLLLYAFLIANTELHQMLKLPVLFHHFFEHKHLNRSESLAHFLIDHYNNSRPHATDSHADHADLPFKNVCCTSFHITAVFPPQAILSITEPSAFDTKNVVSVSEVILPFAYKGSVWQPPKNG